MLDSIEIKPFHIISFYRVHAILLRQIATNKVAAVSDNLRRIATEWDSAADALEAASTENRETRLHVRPAA